MCTKGSWIHNKYTGSQVFVSCGHCPSCLQEKANKRVELIQNHTKLSGLCCLFITLTYANEYVPYICKNEIYKSPEHTSIDVYRDYSVRVLPDGSVKRFKDKHILTSVSLSDCLSTDKLVSIRYKKFNKYYHYENKISVIFYKDIQDYLKRLRINLVREFNFNTPLKYFVCSEYGGAFKRAHFHLLLWCSYDDVKKIEKSHIKSWQFCSRARKKRGFELARDASKYCASYVNCSDSLSLFLQSYFPPKCSRSVHLGYPSSIYTLDLLRSMVAKQDFSVSMFDDFTGKLRIVTLPSHVIGRFFPKFKGMSRLTDFETANILICPERYKEYEKTLSLYIRKPRVFEDDDFIVTDYERECDFETFNRAISLGFTRYARSLHGSSNRSDYALEYIRTWIAYNSYLIKNSHRILADNGQNDSYCYLNIADYPSMENKSLEGIYNQYIITNPNFFPLNFAMSDKYAQYYFLRDKSRVLSDTLPCSINY